MTRRRFIADEVLADRAVLTGSHAAHLYRVLRARIGQEFDIALGDLVRRGTIVSLRDDRVEFELGDAVDSHAVRSVTLALSIFKFDRFDWAVEKCTELGVSRVIPIIAHRTDVNLARAAAKRVERWRRIALEASEQSRRLSAPEIAAPLKLRDYISQEDSTTKVVLAETESEIQAADVCAGDSDIALAVGPEGGWISDELSLFASSGWQAASLGKTILRAETAAIAALAVAQALA